MKKKVFDDTLKKSMSTYGAFLRSPEPVESKEDKDLRTLENITNQKKVIPKNSPQKLDVEKLLKQRGTTKGNNKVKNKQKKKENTIIKSATQMPNLYYDKVIPFLSITELKAFLYIVRKTYGYNKIEGDYISYSQFLAGSGDQDVGCGLGRSSLARALNNLLNYNLITKGESTSRGTFYSINGFGCNEFASVVEREIQRTRQSITEKDDPQAFMTIVSKQIHQIYSIN